MCYVEQIWRKESEGLCSQVTIETDSISKRQELEYPPFPCAVHRSQALAYSLSCSLMDTLLLLHILWLSHVLLLSTALVLSWQYFRLGIPGAYFENCWLRSWWVDIPCHLSMQVTGERQLFPSRLLPAAQEDSGSAYQGRMSILLFSVHWTNINRAQRTADCIL